MYSWTWLTSIRVTAVRAISTSKAGLLLENNKTQFTYNVILRRVRVTTVVVKRNKYYIYVCVCKRTCVRPCVRVTRCVDVCMRVTLLIQHATRMRHIVTSFVAPPVRPHFLTLSQKRHNIRKTSHNIKHVFKNSSF
jgi:hypothetical protein